MDPVDFGKGQEKPSEQNLALLPSSKGRQRKKNSKYLNYKTDYLCAVEQKQPEKSLGGGAGESPKKTPAKGRKPKNVTQEAADEEKQDADNTPQELGEKTSEETPKKPVRARKTPSKRTPAKKTPAKKTPTDGCLPTAAGEAVDTVQQENGTPKPKRKYVKKQHTRDATPVTEPSGGEAQAELPVVPEEETEPGGRRRRSAAKAALKYLRVLTKEMLSHKSEEASSQPDASSDDIDTEGKIHKGGKVIKGRKRKRCHSESDAAEDEDFVPGVEEDEQDVEETEDEESAEDSDLDSYLRIGQRSPAGSYVHKSSNSSAKATNGLTTNTMKIVEDSTETTRKFREEHYSSWVFAEWIPSTSAWHHVPQSDLDKYLPEELHSAALKVSREGLSEETPLQRLSRFEAVSAHQDCWDMLLYAGGPVWAMEWCPTPDGALATQYIALACHRGMDDLHYVNKMYTGPGLVQLWDVGQLEYNKRPDSQPSLAYALAQDKGFIWNLKWCPAGGWELPSCGRKAPFLPRLGILAVATSNGVVTIYSLPHPDVLHSNKKLPASENTGQQLPVYKAEGVVTLKLGAFRAPRHEKSGQVLSMDWLPEKPHNIIAVGFYDGVVGLWDLCTMSSLLRIRESDATLSQLPYRCILAHDHAVRALAFCPASRYLLVTAGEDRYVKTWDLRKPYVPITAQKRYLTNEIYWPLNAPGILMAQESAYAPRGSKGVHYIEHNNRSLFVIPRTGTVWSLSFSDWMNSVVTSDSLGEVIFAVLPQMSYSCAYIKRTIERRFPIYFTSLVPYDTTEEDNQDTGRVEEEGNAVEAQEGGVTEESCAQSDRGIENDNEKEREEGGRGRRAESSTLQFETYKEAVKKCYLHHTDYDMRTFVGSGKRALWKRMQATEIKAKLNLDEMPLAALHKVRFNPNMNCHIWVVSGGQTGLVRLNCLRGMITSQVKKMISDNQAQFNALYSPADKEDAVQTMTDQL